MTGEVVRDTVQKVLVGRPGQIGSGSIPKDAIGELVTARGIADLLDIIKVRHVSGGTSLIALKSYLSGREKFQGETLDWIWFYEEPAADIYTEGLTRTNVGNGPVWMTVTPLQGVSEVVRRFLHERSPERQVVSMTIDDVDHYAEDEKKRIIASYPEHEKEARVKGIPVLGSGRIFPIAEERVAIEHRDIPPHWPRIGGMDFGWDHPFAAVELAWDRDTDTVYVTKAYRLRGLDTAMPPAMRNQRHCLRPQSMPHPRRHRMVVRPADEDGLLIFIGRWLSSRPAKCSATPAAGTAALHRLSIGSRSPFSDFTAKICVWLPGNAHEEILDSYNGIG